MANNDATRSKLLMMIPGEFLDPPIPGARLSIFTGSRPASPSEVGPMANTVSNQRNVDALVRLLGEGDVKLIHPDGNSATLRVAEYLASRGVLVPSALTDEELDRLARYYPPEYVDTYQPDPEYEDLRAELERIAKGEG